MLDYLLLSSHYCQSISVKLYLNAANTVLLGGVENTVTNPTCKSPSALIPPKQEKLLKRCIDLNHENVNMQSVEMLMSLSGNRDVPKHFPLGVGCFDHLRNYCY